MDPKILREKANELATAMKAITDAASKEGRDLTDDERGKWDELDTKRDVILKDEARAIKTAEMESGERRSTPTQPNEYRGQNGTRDTRTTAPTAIDRANAFRGWLMNGTPEGQTEEMRAAARRVGMSLDSKKLTLRLPGTAMRSLHRDDQKAWEERIVAGVVSPDGGGHFTIPDEGMRSLEVALLAFGGMRQVATVIRTNTGAELPIPTVNDTGNTGALLAEISEHTENDIDTFDQLTLGSFKYTSNRVLASVEYLQDNAINAVEVIGRLLGERIARITNTHFTTGDGSSKPLGIVNAATSSSVTTSGATAISYDNIVDLEHSVDPEYRTGARFMFNDTTLKILKKIKVPQFSGDTAGYPLWKPGMVTGDPDTINGYPFTINQSMASGNASKAILFGQLSKYIIRDVRDITLVRLDERWAELGQVGFFAFSRHDGDLLDAGTHPVKYLTMG